MISHIHHGTSESFWVPLVLISASLVYLREWLHLRRQDHDNVAGWRAASFVFGLLFIWIATASPLAALDYEFLTAHMVQHLLLMTLAPPLVLLGMPRKTLPRGLLAAATHPALCWFSAAGTLVVWHIPSVFMLGLQSQMWHSVEQLCFLASGLLFWWPVVRPSASTSKWPESLILLYLFLATLPCDILSGFLVFCDRVVYPAFLSYPRLFGFSALEDQQCAGALMWTSITVVYLIAAAIFTAHLLSPHRPGELAIPQSEVRRIAIRHTDPESVEMA
jgi:putative membrane protein